MRSLLIIIILLSPILIFSCGQEKTKNEVSTTMVNDAPTKEVIPIKDSVDIIIEQRAEQEFNSTIFAGLSFGNSKQVVDKTLKPSDNRIIRILDGEVVRQVIIRDYRADYYNGKLASLTLFANEVSLIDALRDLYSKKYGETKNRYWHFSDCDVSIESRSRSVYKAADGWTTTTLYYDSYYGSNTTFVTTNCCFLEITYKSLPLLFAIERQQQVKDSIEYERQRKEEEKKKERERKLAEEAVSNI